MDTSGRDSTAFEQDIIMAEASWSSAPLLLDDFVPAMSNDEYPVFWSNSSTFDPYFSEDSIIERNLPQDSLQPSLFDDIGSSTSQYSSFLAPGALSSPENPTQRARRTTINRRQKGILTDWIARSPEPYPSREDKVGLATVTGLSVDQVSGWFTRIRQRGLLRVQSNAPAADPNAITRSADETPETRTESEPEGLPENLRSSGYPVALGENPCSSLDYRWLRCTSLPPRSQEPLSSPFERARSLPYIFTLAIINPYPSSSSEVSQGRLSLEVAAPTHKSNDFKGRNQNVEAQPPTCRSVQGLTYPLIKPISTSNFVEAWIEDVAHHSTFITQDLPEIICCSPSVESHDLNTSTQRPLFREVSSTGLQKSIAYDQGPLPHIQTLALRRKYTACMRCEVKKIYCTVEGNYRNSAAGECTTCLGLGLVCVFNDEQHAVPQYSHNENRFDAMSSAGSSASSACSAASYMSFGPRKGRRVAFEKPSQHDSASAPLPSITVDAITTFMRQQIGSSQKRKAQSPLGNDRNKSQSCIYCDKWIVESEMEAHVSKLHTRLYACTFCCRSFGSYYAWKRHEESAHVPQFTWICSPGMMRGEITSSECPVCIFSPTDMTHIPQPPCLHRFNDCWQKPTIERTFYWLDTFKQHLHTVHFKNHPSGLESIDCYVDIEKCKETSKAITPDILTCHFCGFKSGTWIDRARHIKKHFDIGETIELWILGGPYVLNLDGSTINQTSAERWQSNLSKWIS
ncbi:hypothetical protein F4678DRAFT_484194 [Xylaria arbuscula]|nr:hypothetical protein F4678DRAFT_484194 [Xylaria arbuscula]